MAGEREALRKLCCEGAPGCVAFQGGCLACGEAANRILAAGWRPPPEPWNPATSPGHTDLMVPPETLDAFMEANPLPLEPQAAAPEVVERANWWLSLSDDDARKHAVVEIAEEFAEAVVALAARAEAAKREVQSYKAKLLRLSADRDKEHERAVERAEAAERERDEAVLKQASIESHLRAQETIARGDKEEWRKAILADRARAEAAEQRAQRAEEALLAMARAAKRMVCPVCGKGDDAA